MFSDLQVTDVDNTYPNNFNLMALPGTNYSVVNNVVTPATNFFGTLTVPVKVNDGGLDSNTYNLSMTVNPDPEAAKRVRISENPGGGYRLDLIGNPGQQYTVQWSATLLSPSWQTLELKVADPNGMFFSIDNPGTKSRFYRAIIP